MPEKKDISFLVVDDQPQMLTLIKGMLKNNGYKKIAFAENAQDALSVIKANKIDFIIADWHMPNMSGIDLLRLIREDLKYCDIPFLMVTGEMSNEKTIMAVEEGVDDYLVKPITENELNNTIEQIFEKLKPGSVHARIKQIRRFKLQRNYGDALKLALSLKKETDDPELSFIIGECYLHKGEVKKAIKCMQEVLTRKRDSRAIHLVGRVFMANKKYKEALKYMKRSAKLNPMNITRKVEVGEIYLKLGMEDEATSIFESLKDADVSDLDNVDIASVYLKSGHLNKAGKYLMKTVAPIPESIVVFNDYAIELRKTGQYEESIEQYNKCLNIEPKNGTLLFNLASVHFEMKNYPETKKILEKTLKLDPQNNNAEKLLNFVNSQL